MTLAWRVRAADPRHLALLIAPVGAVAVVHVLLFADLRYQIPIMPCMILFAACALWHVRSVVADLTPVAG
jgi:hypothetical protein